MANLCPYIRDGAPAEVFLSRNDAGAYADFVGKLVERYDGDGDLGCSQRSPDCYVPGDGQYPDRAVVDALRRNPVKTWQVCNQLPDVCDGRECRMGDGYVKKYAEVLKTSFAAVKKSCPDCLVVIAGDSPARMYPPVFKALGGKYMDIVDNHFFGEENNYQKIPGDLSFLKKSLKAAGINPSEVKFWITEMSTYSGQPQDDRRRGRKEAYQTELQQARGLVKLFATAFGEGVEKALWAWGMMEGFHCDCCLFDYTGLVYDGDSERQTCDDNERHDLGRNVKKLAYYSMKLMIDKVGGFSDIEKIGGASGSRVYKFAGKGRTVYVAWSESGGNVKLPLGLLGLTKARVTSSVPHFEDGLKLRVSGEKYPAFFEEREVVGDLALDGTPVFIEK